MKSVSIDDKDAAKALGALRRQPALLTEGSLRAIEAELAPESGLSACRRLGLLNMLASGRHLIQWARSGRQTAAALANSIACSEEAADKLRELVGTLDASVARATLALCVREDAVELLQEARAARRAE